MSERESGGRKFSRRELFSFLKPKAAKESPKGVSTEFVDPWRFSLTRREFINSLGTTGILLAINIATAPIASSVGIPTGNESYSSEEGQRLFENPVKGFILGSIVSPLSEEVLFRASPNMVFAYGSEGMRWDVGIPSAMLFALAHNLKGNGFYPTGVYTSRLPLAQFFGGLLHWKLERDGGLVNTVIPHSAYNTIALATFYVARKS